MDLADSGVTTDTVQTPMNGEANGAVVIERRDLEGATRDNDPPQTFWTRTFPTGFKYELVELLKFSWPMMGNLFCNRLIRITATIISGHLGKLSLAAVSMALSLYNAIGSSIGIGLIAACDTLFSQSYGSTNQKQVGIYLQTGIYISSLGCILSWGLLFNTNSILLALGQDPNVSLYTEVYLHIFMPAVFFHVSYQLAFRYLQVQGIIIPPLLVGIIANVFNAALQYILVYPAGMGITGSAISQLLAYFMLSALTVLYTVISKAYKTTWGGWTRHALQDWCEFTKLGVSSILMMCLEYWTFEIAMFLMGVLGQTELAANSILNQLWALLSAMSLGLGSACAFRVGRYLGAERPRSALTVARVTLVVGLISSTVLALAIVALKHQLPYIFSRDPDVVKLAEEMVPIMAIFAFFGNTKNIISGIVRGTGRQAAGGIVSFISFFVIAMPIGIPLMFYTSLGAAGFWWGLNIGLVVASFSLLFIVFRIDWDEEVKMAQLRAKVKPRKQKKSIMENYAEEKTGLLENGPTSNSSLSEHVTSQEHYGSVESNTERQFQLTTSLGTMAHYWRTLYIKRLFAVTICFSLLTLGILCRFVFFIPPPLPHTLSNTTSVLLLYPEMYENVSVSIAVL